MPYLGDFYSVFHAIKDNFVPYLGDFTQNNYSVFQVMKDNFVPY